MARSRNPISSTASSSSPPPATRAPASAPPTKPSRKPAVRPNRRPFGRTIGEGGAVGTLRDAHRDEGGGSRSAEPGAGDGESAGAPLTLGPHGAGHRARGACRAG